MNTEKRKTEEQRAHSQRVVRKRDLEKVEVEKEGEASYCNCCRISTRLQHAPLAWNRKIIIQNDLTRWKMNKKR
jgi:hypothetical protein